MQKRAFERIISNISVRFYCDTDEYCGTVTNLSENGMFICPDTMNFPFDSEFNIIIPIESEVLSLPVKVRRITKTGDRYDGIGVELLSPPQEYLEYVGRLSRNMSD